MVANHLAQLTTNLNKSHGARTTRRWVAVVLLIHIVANHLVQLTTNLNKSHRARTTRRWVAVVLLVPILAKSGTAHD
jgi:hypothetical protein